MMLFGLHKNYLIHNVLLFVMGAIFYGNTMARNTKDDYYYCCIMLYRTNISFSLSTSKNTTYTFNEIPFYDANTYEQIVETNKHHFSGITKYHCIIKIHGTIQYQTLIRRTAHKHIPRNPIIRHIVLINSGIDYFPSISFSILGNAKLVTSIRGDRNIMNIISMSIFFK